MTHLAASPRSIDVPAPPSRASAWLVSGPLLIGLVLFAALLSLSGALLADPDTHWHIAIGQWILEHGTVPIVDSHSHTFLGQPWIAKEWLSQLLLALAFDAGGWGGVATLCAAAIGVTFALLLRLLMRDIRPLPALLFTIAAVLMTAPHFLARPHVLAFPFMLIWVSGLVRAVEQRRMPAPILLLAILFWANLHGGFTLGLMLCGAFALEALTTARDATERRLLFIAWAKFGIAAVLVACITPYGPESMLVTFRIFNLGDALSMISEWKSPDFQSRPVMELVILLGLYASLSRGLKLPVVRLIIVLGLLHLFLKYARNAELLALLVPLALAPILALQWPSMRAAVGTRASSSAASTLFHRLQALGGKAGHLVALLCLLLATVFATSMIRYAGIVPPADTAPTAAFDFARKAHLTGPVFNDYGFGGFLIRAGIPTFIDGRAELFGGDFLKRYANALNLQSAEPLDEFLGRYKVEWTFLAPDRAANALLQRLPGWKLVYKDHAAVIFVRRTEFVPSFPVED